MSENTILEMHLNVLKSKKLEYHKSMYTRCSNIKNVSRGASHSMLSFLRFFYTLTLVHLWYNTLIRLDLERQTSHIMKQKPRHEVKGTACRVRIAKDTQKHKHQSKQGGILKSK